MGLPLLGLPTGYTSAGLRSAQAFGHHHKAREAGQGQWASVEGVGLGV